MRHRRELVEGGLHALVGEADVGALVAHLIAVVGRAEDRDALAVVVDCVALLLHFVGAHKKLQVVPLQEGGGVVGPEAESHTTLAGHASWLGVRVCGIQDKGK